MKNKEKNSKIDISRLDKIIKKTIDAINASRDQIYDIAETARKECKRLEQDLADLREQAKQVIKTVERLENELRESRRHLMLLSKTFGDGSEKKLREAYERADNLRIELAVKKEQEQNIIMRRNEIEIRLKEAYKTVEKAENLIAQVGKAMEYLSGDLDNLSSQLKDIQLKHYLGIKIIEAQEEERKRVARDIHDGPAQSMSNVVLKAEICEKLIDVDIQRTKDELKELKNVVRGCLQDVRRIIYDLRPMSLDDLGLIPTIQRYVSNFQLETGIEMRFRTGGTCDDISPVISLTVFRIVQEALSNVKKHASADNVIIHLSCINNNLSLFIFDNGNGFSIEELDKKERDENGGFGIYSMKERVELLGGSFVIDSDIGKGTRIKIDIPLQVKGEVKDEQYTGSNSR